MRREKRVPLFKTEAELCASFIEWARPQGWTAYAETEGWDILLVNSSGVQLGIQAKMSLNLKVIAQTAPDDLNQSRVGPDYRAILVPDAADAAFVMRMLGFGVFHPELRRISYVPPRPCDLAPIKGFEQSLPDGKPSIYDNNAWHDWNPVRRHELPEYVPDVSAGASGPIQLTKWKIGALRLTACLAVQGYLTRENFKRYGVDHRRWVGPCGWLIPGDVDGQWIAGPGLRFDQQHPKVYAEILTEVTQDLAVAGAAMAPRTARPAGQSVLL